MPRRRHADLFGGRLPALERSILKLRAFELILVLFYAEELKRWLINHLKANNALASHLRLTAPAYSARKRGETWRHGLEALHQDGAISSEQKTEILSLIEYRNTVGHEIHHLLSDLSTNRITKDLTIYSAKQRKQYDYTVIRRFQRIRKHLGEIYKTHRYVFVMNINGLVFDVAERTFQSEIKRLTKKIDGLYATRCELIRKINAEIIQVHKTFRGERDPRHPLNQYDDGRLTKRGEELCYRLFDKRMSEAAIAHLIGISLSSARKRKQMWQAIGGFKRTRKNLLTLPNRKFGRHRD